MDKPQFSFSRMKLQRAREFIGELKFEEEAYKASDPVHAQLDWSSGRPEIQMRWQATGLKVGAILGDAIHSMRTALDLMAAKLARIAGQRDDKVYFPFAASESELDAQIKNKNFHLVGKDAVALLKTFQPYRGGNKALRGIHDLDMMDKHRMLIPAVNEMGLKFEAQYSLDGPSATESVKVILDDFFFKFPHDTAFSGEPMVKTLEELVEVVEGILEAFACLVAARPG